MAIVEAQLKRRPTEVRRRKNRSSAKIHSLG
jgi:hypothetical protein